MSESELFDILYWRIIFAFAGLVLSIWGIKEVFSGRGQLGVILVACGLFLLISSAWVGNKL